MITIENKNFQAVIDPQGAQLTHLFNKAADFDYLWNGAEWPKHAPVLFPAIGRSNDDQYKLHGKKYSMPQHGFASNQQFKIISQTATAVTLGLAANSATKKLYPFDFELQLTFTLQPKGLVLSFMINNQANETLPYSLGSHPAFNLPLAGVGEFNDYQLTFAGNFDLPLQAAEIVKTPAPYRTGKTEIFAATQTISLSHDLFKKGLRIIMNPGIETISLTSAATEHTVKVVLGDFKNVCLWTKEDQDLPFLCIEPFNGLPDVLGEPVDWSTKEAGWYLEPGKHQLMQYEIELA
ncbi:MAG: aldose 1-epimerase family protein [Liquorilactobacillus ghanensis]|uniref:aldose 1-epimerase family protein n=1 Tax=Liquorilactobacillus ghanensis TaxID=399370 RepID=UPI0039E7B6EB